METVSKVRSQGGTQRSYRHASLQSQRLADACATAGIDLTLGMQPGYDHSYYFISSFMADHLARHAERLETGA